MADENWLKLDNVNDNNVANINVVLNSEVPALADHEQEIQISYDKGYNASSVNNGVADSVSLKRSCLSRRQIIFGAIGITLVISIAVGVSLAMRSPFSIRETPTSATTAHHDGKKKLENDSIGNNRVSSPTPANAQYFGRPTISPGPTPSNAFRAADIIDSIARNGGNEFKDTRSYQSLAKNWVLTHDFPVTDGSSITIEEQVIQLYALACIYFGTFSVRSEWTDVHYGPDIAIPGWYSSRGWLGTPEDVCSNWHGLTCNNEGRILKIELDTNGLTGSFPPESALLHETLNTIDLYNNMLHNAGDLGNSFLGELTNLEYLYLGTTSFEYDGVPSVLGKLTALKELDISYSLYFGSLDGAMFSNLSNLRYLVIDGNAYNSPLPKELTQLPNLEYLYAGFCFLEGGLDYVSSMQNIIELWMDDNPNLKGPIPSSIGALENLASFSASNCGLTGTIPTEIGDTRSMIQMWLNDNNLTGEIPSEIANLVTMKIFNVQNNFLEGEMPSKICGRRRPFGRLEELGADCDGTVTCDEECCTCCGDQCSSSR